MRSYALFILACAVLHARAASIPVQDEAEKKLPTENDALDNVSLDNSVNQQELVDPPKTVKDVENSLRNSIPIENVPVKVIEEKPVIKTIAINENSNDYVPDNDDSINIKRVEIDLKNPGPPQRQEHDSQTPGYHQEKERAVAAIRQSIAESENIFKRGIQEVTQKFKNYFANTEDLKVVQKNIQNLKETVNADFTKLSNTINTSLNTISYKPEQVIEKLPEIVEVENQFKTLETNFNTGVNMLTEGVEILSILKEEDESELLDKISGKAENVNIDTEHSKQTGASPDNPTSSSTTASPSPQNPVLGWLGSFINTMTAAYSDLGNSVQNLVAQNQNQNGSTNSTSNYNIFQNWNIPNIFQNQQNQNQNNQAQGSPPAGAQADDASTTARPNIFQQFATNIQTPITQASNSFFQAVSSFFPWTGQGNQQSNPAPAQPAPVSLQTASDQPVVAPAQGTNEVPAADQVQGSNAVAPPTAPQTNPTKPAKETQPVRAPVQGPIQQLVQNNPIVQGITHTVQRIQGLSNPSKPRDTPVAENADTKGHRPGGNNDTGDNNNNGGVDKISDPVKQEPQTITEVKNVEQPSVAEVTKTE